MRAPSCFASQKQSAAFTFLFLPVNKSNLREAILAHLRAELALQTRAAWLARDEATNEESRAENKYDTRGQEAAYLAEGQARIAAEIEQSLALYSTLPFPDFAPDSAIALGALIQFETRGGPAFYFLGPRAGGAEISVAGRSVLVVTPQSPLGRQLLGRRVGEVIATAGRPGAGAMKIIAVS